ncbi:unnamed protein product [Merluccius merluccius]
MEASPIKPTRQQWCNLGTSCLMDQMWQECHPSVGGLTAPIDRDHEECINGTVAPPCSRASEQSCGRKYTPVPGPHSGASKGHDRGYTTSSESSERGNLLGLLRCVLFYG